MDLLLIFLVFVRLFLKVLSCPWLVYSIFPYKKPRGFRYNTLYNISNVCAKNTFLLDTLKDCRTRLEWSKEVQEVQDVLTYCRILKPRFAYILDLKTFPLVSYSYSLESFDANRATIILILGISIAIYVLKYAWLEILTFN
jgi:hypothetical protein